MSSLQAAQVLHPFTLSDVLLWSREAFAFGSPHRKQVGWSSATVTSAALLMLQTGGDMVSWRRTGVAWGAGARRGQLLAWLPLQAQTASSGST